MFDVGDHGAHEADIVDLFLHRFGSAAAGVPCAADAVGIHDDEGVLIGLGIEAGLLLHDFAGADAAMKCDHERNGGVATASRIGDEHAVGSKASWESIRKVCKFWRHQDH